jgi:hypothetical protein
VCLCAAPSQVKDDKALTAAAQQQLGGDYCDSVDQTSPRKSARSFSRPSSSKPLVSKVRRELVDPLEGLRSSLGLM